MEIHGAGGARGPQPVYTRLASHSVDLGPPVQTGVLKDQVEISSLGQLLDSISRIPEIRHERVAEIRGQIAQGVYETPEKWEIALERLIGELDLS